MAGMGFDFIGFYLSYHLVVASSLSLDMGFFFFFGVFQCSLDGCSTASWDFGVLSGADEFVSSHSAILNWKNYLLLFKI